MNKIRVLVIELNKEPYKKRIPHTLKDMQKEKVRNSINLLNLNLINIGRWRLE